MKYYKITLLKKGQKEEIITKAENKVEAITAISNRETGIVVKAEETDIPFDKKIKELTKILKATFSKKKLNYPMFISAIRQLGALTKAQISIKDSLDNISQNTTDPLVKEIFEKASTDIDNGLSLTNTFEEYEAYIGNLAVAMVKLGEKTGELGESLEDMADIYENIEENRQKFKSAMRYPIITLTAMAGAFTVLIMYVVPKFKEIFEQLHSELPLPTKILLGAEYVLNHYGLVVLGIIAGSIILHKYLYKTNKDYKYKFDSMLLKMKVIGPVVKYASLSRFLLVFTKLTKAGIPMVDALTISNGILDNSVLNQKLDNVIKDINQGQSLTIAITKNDLLDNVTLQMISAGEEAGNLDVMLENASNYYKTQFDIIIDGLGDAIEPIMMAFIGGLVLLLALGIFLPMWDLAKAAKA
jgi:general secretion pathway protein F